MRKMVIFFAMLACVSLTACSKGRDVVSAPAEAPPQINGKIVSIKAGNPSYVFLNHVDVISKNGHTQESKKKIKLPGGHFVSPKHWQSNGDTLDLFIGDGFILMTKTGKMLDDANGPNFAGIVKSVYSKKMVVEKVLYDHKSSDNRAMKATNQTVTIHFTPYTTVSSEGSNQSKVSNIRPGDAVLFVLIGPPNEYIATQITDFSSTNAAGWDMVK